MVFDVEIHVQSIGVGAADVHLNGMVDDQINRDLRIDFFRIPPHFHHGVPEGCQINNSRYACEILKNDTGRAEWNFFPLSVWGPRRNPSDIVLGDEKTVVVAKCPFQ